VVSGRRCRPPRERPEGGGVALGERVGSAVRVDVAEVEEDVGLAAGDELGDRLGAGTAVRAVPGGPYDGGGAGAVGDEGTAGSGSGAAAGAEEAGEATERYDSGRAHGDRVAAAGGHGCVLPVKTA
jgi:hypothetical protein